MLLILRTPSNICLLAPRPHHDPYELELLEGEAAEEMLDRLAGLCEADQVMVQGWNAHQNPR